MNIYKICNSVESQQSDFASIRGKMRNILQTLEYNQVNGYLLQLARYIMFKQKWEKEHFDLARLYSIYHTYCLFYKTAKPQEEEKFL